LRFLNSTGVVFFIFINPVRYLPLLFSTSIYSASQFRPSTGYFTLNIWLWASSDFTLTVIWGEKSSFHLSGDFILDGKSGTVVITKPFLVFIFIYSSLISILL